jgi:cysteine-rich repeat protein
MNLRTLVIGVGLAVSSAALAAPGEVPNLAWCAGPKNCLQWGAVTGATQYHVYRGERLSLSCLLNPAHDSCDDGTVLLTSTGATVTEVPATGSFFWFLITAADGGGEGSYGNATARPRDSQHNGICAPSCSPAGAGCGVSGDCCSASCVLGTCQTACCVGNGAACLLGTDCCNGVCNLGFCQAGCGDGVVAAGEQCDDGNSLSGDGCSTACTGEIGFYCVGSPSSCQPCPAGQANCNLSSADGCEATIASDPQNCGGCGVVCGGAPNAEGSCAGSVCGIACHGGFASCDGIDGNGCECAGNSCCVGACQPPHINGLGQSFDSCAPLGVPGNAATYDHALAVSARAAWPFVGNDGDVACPGSTQAVARQTGTQCAVWVYTKTTAGYVHLNAATNLCLCPTVSDPTWF